MPGRASKLSTRSSSPSPSEGDFQKPTEKKTWQFFNKGNWWLVFILKHHWIHEWKNTHWILSFVCFRDFNLTNYPKSGFILFLRMIKVETPISRKRHGTFLVLFHQLHPACSWMFENLKKSRGKSISFVSFFGGMFLSNNLLQGYWKGQL